MHVRRRRARSAHRGLRGPLVHDPHPVRTPARPDVPGLLLGTGGLTALALGFDRAGVVYDGDTARAAGWTTP